MTGHRVVAAVGPGGPLGRYVTDPGGTTAHLARLLLHALAATDSRCPVTGACPHQRHRVGPGRRQAPG